MKCFKYAIRGIIFVINSERNMRVHLCFAFYVILAGTVTQISAAQWAAVLICISLVCAAECFNSAVEKLCDTLHPEKSENIKNVKDASAAAVMCIAAASAIVGGIVFFNREKIAAALDFAKAQPVLAGLIILTLIPALVFTFRIKDKRSK